MSLYSPPAECCHWNAFLTTSLSLSCLQSRNSIHMSLTVSPLVLDVEWNVRGSCILLLMYSCYYLTVGSVVVYCSYNYIPRCAMRKCLVCVCVDCYGCCKIMWEVCLMPVVLLVIAKECVYYSKTWPWSVSTLLI